MDRILWVYIDEGTYEYYIKYQQIQNDLHDAGEFVLMCAEMERYHRMKLNDEFAVNEYVYKKIGDREVYITFFKPSCKVYEKAPVYFNIPGGGWHSATRESAIDFCKKSIHDLRAKGVAVAIIDYRTYNQDKVSMREVIEDCQDALKYIVCHEKELGIDKEKICLTGHSAGGHLALMLAYTAKIFLPQGKVSCVAAMSAPTILYTENVEQTLNFDIEDLFQDNEKDKEKYSPYCYVDKTCPPTLLCAGTSDRLVFCNSSELLFRKLSECGAECELVLSVGGGHCFEKMHDSLAPDKNLEDIQKIITEFVLRKI